jgi:formate/nitrite transporter FocA (FNT family)
VSSSPPITAFVAAGFEHSVANMYVIPLGVWLRHQPRVVEMAGLNLEEVADLTWRSFVVNSLLPVTLGNLVGGTVMVGGSIGLSTYDAPRKTTSLPTSDRRREARCPETGSPWAPEPTSGLHVSSW